MTDSIPSTPRLTIRRATSVDNRLLADIGAETFRDTFGADNTPEDMTQYLAQSFSPEKQARELAEPGTFFLIADVDGAPAGFARIKVGEPPSAIGARVAVEIARFYARKAWIGKGVGQALMQACLDEAAHTGHAVIWLDVWERNPRAIAFYARWGFSVVGEQIFQLGHDAQRDLLMARPIAARINA